MPGEKSGDEQPPAPRMLLGIQLVSLRTDPNRRISAEDAAKHIGLTKPLFYRVEGGLRAIERDKLAKLCDFYGLDGARTSALQQLAEATKRAAWWSPYDDVLSDDVYIGMEQSANELDATETILVHGLLQTKAYARAMISTLLPGFGPSSVDRLVNVRLKRQDVLHDEERRYHFIIDEAALHREVGGRETMLEQIRHLREVCELPSVTLQIIPNAAGAHIGAEGPFSIFTFRANTLHENDWRFFYTATSVGNHYESKQPFVLTFVDRFERLTGQAATAEESIQLIDKLAREYA